MSNGKGIAIAGLIFGLIGLGLGGYVFYDNTLAPLLGLKPIPTSEPTQNINEYFIETTEFQPPSTGTAHYFEPLSKEFTFTKSTSVYISFNCYVYFSDPDNIYIHMRINDTQISAFGMRASSDSTNIIRIPLIFQYLNNSFTPGTYDFSIWAYVGNIFTSFYTASLYIQTVS